MRCIRSTSRPWSRSAASRTRSSRRSTSRCTGSSGSGPTRSCIVSETLSNAVKGQAGILKRPVATRRKETSPSASARFSPGPVRFVVCTAKNGLPELELMPAFVLTCPYRRTEVMLVERGLQVMNLEVVGDAYAIASNYLRKTGAISDTIATNDALLKIIVQMFQRGEFNRIRLANKAIAKFESTRFEDTLLV